MYRKVLLAYDGSEEGRRALREGAGIAQICGANVFLFAVVNNPSVLLFPDGVAAVATLDDTDAYKEVLAEGVRKRRAPTVTAW